MVKLKTALMAAELLNDRVIPCCEAQGVCLFTGRGTDYCSNVAHPDYQLYLPIEDIDHSCHQAQHTYANVESRIRYPATGLVCLICQIRSNLLPVRRA
ncbi:MAG: hypothetical protein KGQ93_13550 [Cyanobacteria bacterium REEB459]|nr:hypothetical protein [Cyanobacteria bacterium REEB459]